MLGADSDQELIRDLSDRIIDLEKENARLRAEAVEMADETDTLKAKLARVVEIHKRDQHTDRCFDCLSPWPCATVAAAKGGEE